MGTLLIVGCGDVGARILPLVMPQYRVFALTRDHAQAKRLAACGVHPIVGDLDVPQSLAPLAGLAEKVIHLAPPPDAGESDPRTAHLLAALGGRATGAMVARAPQRLVYISTSAVYGDCAGAWVDELRPVRPATDRGRRRVDAEARVLEWGSAQGVAVAVLRVPGIYAADRLPIERLRRGTPALRDEDDVYTNHIHADDLASIAARAIEQAPAGAIYNAADDSAIKMGAYFDLVADRAGLPRPDRISRAEAASRVSPALLSFMSESRRLINQRMKHELRVRLAYPTVYHGVPEKP